MVIDRYLGREITKPLLATLGILTVIFGSYTSARYLSDAAAGLLSGRLVGTLVFLKLIVALEVLLPITFYLSVVVALGRLHADSEMTALEATGVGSPRVLRVVLGYALGLALVVGGLSVLVRPWAYAQSYRLRAAARAEFDLGRFEGGRFYRLAQGDRVFFAETVHREESRAEGVFVQRELPDRIQLVSAREARQVEMADGRGEALVFRDGYAYEFFPSGDRERVVRFREFTLPLRTEPPTPGYKRKAAPTSQLARSRRGADVAELQWRLSTPFSTVLLGLLGLPLSRTAPRRGKYARTLAAVLLFALYYMVELMAKTWVEQGVVGPFPGVWWSVAVLGVLTGTLLWRSDAGYPLRRALEKSRGRCAPRRRGAR
ncbi:MAG: LPS export ABC transporter permease LptF [Deferrisomatales bacterium]